MSTTPSSSTTSSAPPPNTTFTVKEFTSPSVHISATTAPLTSHIIIGAFEDKYKMHCPEMTFMQNSLCLTHRKQNLSLVFSTPEAILGTIHPSLDESIDTTEAAPKPNENLSDPKLFIPKPVQVQASHQWQKHQAQKQQQQQQNNDQDQDTKSQQPTPEEVCTTVGDWTYSSLYQGQLFINHHTDSKVFFLLQPPPLKTTPTTTPQPHR
jgi:hypothetical protein